MQRFNPGERAMTEMGVIAYLVCILLIFHPPDQRIFLLYRIVQSLISGPKGAGEMIG